MRSRIDAPRIREITDAFFLAYDRFYEVTKAPDGSSVFCAFCLWGPGKVAKVQCDAAAMISPDQFRRFVSPELDRQCQSLDRSMYHLDGTQAVPCLDAVMEIDSIDAVEWTPQAGIPGGGSSRWYDLYRRILTGGKSVQAVGVEYHEVLPFLDAVGHEGMYVMTSAPTEKEARELVRAVYDSD